MHDDSVVEYQLTDEEKAEFHIDEKRAEIRRKASALQLSTTTIHVVDKDGDVWDTVQGDIPADDDLAVVMPTLSPEEVEAKAAEEAASLEEAKRLEEVIRPLALKRLRAEARAEFVEQLRSKADEILKLRAELAKFQLTEVRAESPLKAANALLRSRVAGLKAHKARLEGLLKAKGKEVPPEPSAEATDTEASEPSGAAR